MGIAEIAERYVTRWHDVSQGKKNQTWNLSVTTAKILIVKKQIDFRLLKESVQWGSALQY
jgi:hypothetical protein